MSGSRIVLWVIGATPLLCAQNVRAMYALPADQLVRYEMHEDPNDSESEVVLFAALYLSAQSSDSEAVGWLIVDVLIIETSGQHREWVDFSPYVGTPDGLWWVVHTHIQDPVASEFDVPPFLEGTAAGLYNTSTGLEYSVGGASCDPLCAVMYNGDAAALDYDFIEDGGSEPIAHGASETVAVIDEPLLPPEPMP